MLAAFLSLPFPPSITKTCPEAIAPKVDRMTVYSSESRIPKQSASPLVSGRRMLQGPAFARREPAFRWDVVAYFGADRTSGSLPFR
jgi:hypothetical protein